MYWVVEESIQGQILLLDFEILLQSLKTKYDIFTSETMYYKKLGT